MDFRSVVIAALLQVPLLCMVSTSLRVFFFSSLVVTPSISLLMSTLISTEETLVYVLQNNGHHFSCKVELLFFLTPKPLRNKHRCVMNYLTKFLVYIQKHIFSHAGIHFI